VRGSNAVLSAFPRVRLHFEAAWTCAEELVPAAAAVCDAKSCVPQLLLLVAAWAATDRASAQKEQHDCSSLARHCSCITMGTYRCCARLGYQFVSLQQQRVPVGQASFSSADHSHMQQSRVCHFTCFLHCCCLQAVPSVRCNSMQ
jgi:hypothetical protein